jgi:thioredoxin reductase
VVYDAVIAGGGPAGLSAALVLGRCRRHVLVCDTGRPRNAASQGLHGFLTRDGVPPGELLRIAREQLEPYDVEIRQVEVTDARREDDEFLVLLDDRSCIRARLLLIATGVVDELPAIPGLRELYGRSVFHCPYCDGWELRDQPLAVYGRGRQGAGLAVSMKTWSGDVVLFTDGPSHLRQEDVQQLERHGITVRRERVVRLEGYSGVLERVVFANGDTVPRRALFFSTGQAQRSGLPMRLGCRFNEKGTVRTDRNQATDIPGLFVAGDACRDVQFAVVAAAEGAKAGVAMNKLLQAQASASEDSQGS